MILTELASRRPHMTGWAYGGVGVGIALSGALVAVVKPIGDWQAAWWSSAALTALLAGGGLVRGGTGPAENPAAPGPAGEASPRHFRWFAILSVSYFLEGAGYIVCRDVPGRRHLRHRPVVAVEQRLDHRRGRRRPLLRAWTWLSRRVSRPTLITGALLLQAVGIALPALTAAVPAALAAAVLFGATFIGITTLSLATGRHLRVPRAVAILHRRLRDRPGPGPVGGRAHPARRLSPGAAGWGRPGPGGRLGAALLRVRFPPPSARPHHPPPRRGARRSSGDWRPSPSAPA